MAEWGEMLTETLEAAADLSTYQYCAVRLSAANKMNLASDAGASSIRGILQTKPKSGEFGTVGWLGKSKVVVGAAVTAGNPLTINGSGRAVAVTSGVGLLAFLGTALDTATTDGEIIGCRVNATGARWSGAV